MDPRPIDKAALAIKAFFDKLHPAELSVWQEFAQAGRIVATRKNQELHPVGGRAREIFFVLRGGVAMLLPGAEATVCTDFAFEGEFLVDYQAFLKGQASPFELRCVEACELFAMEREAFLRLTDSEPGRVFCQKIAEHLYFNKLGQQVDLLGKTAEQRYAGLLARGDQVARRAPLKLVASYLGIAPESLSRIRRRLARPLS